MILTSEFGNLDFDRRVLAAQLDHRKRSIAELAELLAAPRMAVAAFSRLERRDSEPMRSHLRCASTMH